MKPLATILTSSLMALWIGAIAVLSVQNFTGVSLQFLGWRSFELPVGIVLAFSVGVGLVGAAFMPMLLGAAPSRQWDTDE